MTPRMKQERQFLCTNPQISCSLIHFSCKYLGVPESGRVLEDERNFEL
jgi:hypothetical protein